MYDASHLRTSHYIGMQGTVLLNYRSHSFAHFFPAFSPSSRFNLADFYMHILLYLVFYTCVIFCNNSYHIDRLIFSFYKVQYCIHLCLNVPFFLFSLPFFFFFFSAFSSKRPFFLEGFIIYARTGYVLRRDLRGHYYTWNS